MLLNRIGQNLLALVLCTLPFIEPASSEESADLANDNGSFVDRLCDNFRTATVDYARSDRQDTEFYTIKAGLCGNARDAKLYYHEIGGKIVYTKDECQDRPALQP